MQRSVEGGNYLKASGKYGRRENDNDAARGRTPRVNLVDVCHLDCY